MLKSSGVSLVARLMLWCTTLCFLSLTTIYISNFEPLLSFCHSGFRIETGLCHADTSILAQTDCSLLRARRVIFHSSSHSFFIYSLHTVNKLCQESRLPEPHVSHTIFPLDSPLSHILIAKVLHCRLCPRRRPPIPSCRQPEPF